MHLYLSVALNALYYILVYPLLALFHGLLTILAPVSRGLHFLLLPPIVLFQSLSSVVLYPFRAMPNFEVYLHFPTF